jgi:molecular chaperone Hsp33
MDLLVKSIAIDEPVLVIGLVNTATVERARVIHDTYPTASAALGRTISGALLMASMLKEGQKISLQVVGEGPLKEVFAEADWLCRVRGYVRKPHVHMGLLGESLDVGRAIGQGFLHVTKDLGIREPYHGSIPLQTGEIASDLAYYLTTSEQIPAAVSVGVFVDTDNSVRASGGFMVHALPAASDEIIGYLENRIGNMRSVSSMVMDGMEPREIIGEILGMPYDILDRKEVVYFCPCSKDRVMAALVTLGEKDIQAMAEKGEALDVQCHFCRTDYAVSKEELFSLLREMTGWLTA